jgi:hypothetical protein
MDTNWRLELSRKRAQKTQRKKTLMEIRLKQAYFDRANDNMAWFEKTHDASFLLYAALEFRMGIERYLFMWLATIHKKLSKEQLQLYRARDLKRSVLSIEPDFILKLEFAKALCEANNLQIAFTLPNLDELSEIYGRLGAYLHAIKNPSETVENPEWWQNLSRLLERSKKVLRPLVSVPFMWPRMNKSGESAYEKFKHGILTYEKLVTLLRTNPSEAGARVTQ